MTRSQASAMTLKAFNRQLGSVRVLLVLFVALAVFSIGFVVSDPFKTRSPKKANKHSESQKSQAQSHSDLTQEWARLAAAHSSRFVDSKPQEAMALALLSYDLLPNISALGAMRQTLKHDTLLVPFDGSKKRFLTFLPTQKQCLFFVINGISIRKQAIRLELWDIESNKRVHSFETSLFASSRYEAPLSLVSPDGHFVLVVGEGQKGVHRVEIWDLRKKEIVREPFEFGSVDGKDRSREDSGIRNGAYWHHRYADDMTTVVTLDDAPELRRINLKVPSEFDAESDLIPLPSAKELCLKTDSQLRFFSLKDGALRRSLAIEPSFDSSQPSSCEHEIVDCNDEYLVLRTEGPGEKEDEDFGIRGTAILSLKTGKPIWQEKHQEHQSIVDGPFLHAQSKSFYVLRDRQSLGHFVVEKHSIDHDGRILWTFQESAEVYGIELNEEGAVAISCRPYLKLVGHDGRNSQTFEQSLASDERSMGTRFLALFGGIYSAKGSGWGQIELPFRRHKHGVLLPQEIQRVGDTLLIKQGASGQLDFLNLANDDVLTRQSIQSVLTDSDSDSHFLLGVEGQTQLWSVSPLKQIRMWATKSHKLDVESQIFSEGKLALVRSNGTLQDVWRLMSLRNGETLQSVTIPYRAHTHPTHPSFVYRDMTGAIATWSKGEHALWNKELGLRLSLLGIRSQPPRVLALEEDGTDQMFVRTFDLKGIEIEDPIKIEIKDLDSASTKKIIRQAFKALPEETSRETFKATLTGAFGAHCEFMEGTSSLRSFVAKGKVQVHRFESAHDESQDILVSEGQPINAFLPLNQSTIHTVQHRNVPTLFGIQEVLGERVPVRWPLDLVSYTRKRTDSTLTDVQLRQFGLIDAASVNRLEAIWQRHDRKVPLLAALKDEPKLFDHVRRGALKRAQEIDDFARLCRRVEAKSRRPFRCQNGKFTYQGIMDPTLAKHLVNLIQETRSLGVKRHHSKSTMSLELAEARLLWHNGHHAKLIGRITPLLRVALLDRSLELGSKTDEHIFLWYASLIKTGKRGEAEALHDSIRINRPGLLEQLNTLTPATDPTK